MAQPHSQHKLEKSDNWAYFYLAPVVLVFIIFLFLPLGRTFLISFYDWNLVSPNRSFVGFRNYLSLLQDGAFWQIVRQSLLYILLALLGNFTLPLILALLTARFSEREASFYQSLLFIPTIVPVSIGALLWLWIYLPTGGPLSRATMAVFGTPVALLNNPKYALWSVAIVAAWKFMGFNYLFILAGLKAIPKTLLEAAQLDYARGLRLYTHIILPLLGPTLLFVFLSTVLQALDNSFVPIEILTSGGPIGSTSQLLFAIYQEGFRFFRAGQASAIAVLTLLLLGGAIVWQFQLLDQKVSYER